MALPQKRRGLVRTCCTWLNCGSPHYVFYSCLDELRADIIEWQGTEGIELVEIERVRSDYVNYH